MSFFPVNQSIRHWLYLAFLLLIVLGIMVFIENIAHTYNIRFDLTPDRHYSLSPQSIKILKNLPGEVKITVFYESGHQMEMRNILSLYSAQSSKVSFQLKDLDRNPGEAKRYGITKYGQTVVEFGEKKKIISYPAEENIVSATLNIIQDKKKTIYFIKGHGENDTLDGKSRGYGQIKRDLETEGYEIKDLWLMREKMPPSACLIIIAGPKRDLLPEELGYVGQFIQNGGRLFWMIDPDMTLPNINGFLAKYDILVENAVIVDRENRLFGGDFLTPLIPLYREHPITKDFNIPCLFAVAGPIKIKKGISDGIFSEILAMSSPESWAVKERKGLAKGWWDVNKEEKGPHPVAVIVSIKKEGVQPTQEGRMAIFGDSDFVNNFYVNLYGNRDLFLNTVDWLTESETLISIRYSRKEYSFRLLKPADTKRLFWLCIVLQPGLIVAIGIVIFVRRKFKG